MNGETFRFPVAEGDLRQPGGKAVVRQGIRRPQEKAKEDEDSFPIHETFKSRRKSDEDKEAYDPDDWSATADVSIWHHCTPRTKLFIPDELGGCPSKQIH